MNYATTEQAIAEKQFADKMAAASMNSARQIGGIVGGNHAAMPQARPDTEIEGCLNRTNNAVERLHGRVSAIEDRLRPVMRATGLNQKGGVGAPTEALSPLGDAITSIESRVDAACDRLEALLLGLAL